MHGHGTNIPLGAYLHQRSIMPGRMKALYNESGRSARIEKRYFNRIVRIELTSSALVFYSTLLGFKCKDLLLLPLAEINSVRLVIERGNPSFEVNAFGRAKFCWYDTTNPEDWESAFGSAGIRVEHAPEEVPHGVPGDD